MKEEFVLIYGKGDKMYKSLMINDFRQFNDMKISLGKKLTVIAGRNSTGKSTILGILANSG